LYSPITVAWYGSSRADVVGPAETALELGYLNEEQFEEWVRPEEMISPES